MPQLPPPLKMPVGQLIAFAAGVCDADPSRMEAVAVRLGLDPARFRRQPFVKLSGGQKQKLLISIALGRDAELLVLDEPAANLDPEARQIFFELLAERQDTAAMLISSHRLDEVAALVNRVIELDQGVVVLDDRVADLVDLRQPPALPSHADPRRRGLRPRHRSLGFPQQRRRPYLGRPGRGTRSAAVSSGCCRVTRPCLAGISMEEAREPEPAEVRYA